MRLIIRSQLIPVPISWQLGAVDQHMPSNHLPVVPGLKTSFLPSNASSPQLLAEQRPQASGDPARRLSSAQVKTCRRTGPSLGSTCYRGAPRGTEQGGGKGGPSKAALRDPNHGLAAVRWLWTEKQGPVGKITAVRPQINHLTALCLSFLTCKVGIITVPTSQGC